MSDQLSADLASLRIDRSKKPQRGFLGIAWRVAVVLVAAWIVFAFVVPSLSAKFFKTEVEVTEIASVSPAQADVELTATGYVIPQVTAKVGAKVIGRIAKVNLREGETVSAGAILFELDALDQQAAVQSANARASAASARIATARAASAETQLNYDRQKKLADTGTVPKATVDDLSARLAALDAQTKAAEAEAQAAQAEARALATGLGNLRIVAPIDGTAVTKPASVGDIAGPTNVGSLVELVDFKSLLVEVDVPEVKLGVVHKGGPVEIVLDALAPQRFPGEVVELGPRLNRAKATGLVKVKFDAIPEDLRPEMSARVSFRKKKMDDAERKAGVKTVVPSSAVVTNASGSAVFVFDQGKVKLVPIVVGAKMGEGFVVESGPGPGTKIVRDPPKELSDGQAVKEKAP
jgi:RND family efflux transporter MFP subunit